MAEQFGYDRAVEIIKEETPEEKICETQTMIADSDGNQRAAAGRGPLIVASSQKFAANGSALSISIAQQIYRAVAMLNCQQL
jgi:hypothetical protein